jgi:hypothetical protein
VSREQWISAEIRLRIVLKLTWRHRTCALGASVFGTALQREAVNRFQSSWRVGYLRATVRDSNFYKALLLHDFRKRVARESLRRAFGKGSLTLGSGITLPSG